MSSRKIKTRLYVPPHARSLAVNDDETPCTSKKTKLCDDSNLLFLKAQEAEERNNRFYLNCVKENTLHEEPTTEITSERPKICAIPAKRLVSNALGIKPVFTSAEAEEHVEILNKRKELKKPTNTSFSKKPS